MYILIHEHLHLRRQSKQQRRVAPSAASAPRQERAETKKKRDKKKEQKQRAAEEGGREGLCGDVCNRHTYSSAACAYLPPPSQPSCRATGL